MYPIVSIMDENFKELHIYADGTLKGSLTGITVVNYAPIIKRRFQAFINDLLESYIPVAKGSVDSSGGPQETDENFESTSVQNGTDSGGK